MAFGGVEVQTRVDDLTVRSTGMTLLARIGAFAIAAADSGRFTTAAAAANETALSATFGPGRGNWVAGDEELVDVTIHDGNTAAQGGAGQTSLVHLVTGTPTITAGNLVIDLHNHGAQDSGALHFVIRYNPKARLSIIDRSGT